MGESAELLSKVGLGKALPSTNALNIRPCSCRDIFKDSNRDTTNGSALRCPPRRPSAVAMLTPLDNTLMPPWLFGSDFGIGDPTTPSKTLLAP